MANNISDPGFKQGTPANNNFNTSTNFLPAIYSKKVLNFFRKSSVIEAVTNTDYTGEISSFGDSVKIIKEPTITVHQYERGADVAATKLTDEETTLVVDTANAFKFIVDDIESKMSHVNFKEVAASSAAYALKDAFDAGVLASLVAGASNGAGTTPDHILGADLVATGVDYASTTKSLLLGDGSDAATIDPLDLLARMARLLDEANVPEEGRYVVAGPAFYEQLSQSSSKLLNVDFNAGQGSIRNGLVTSGKLRGFSMYRSNNMPQPEDAAVNAPFSMVAGHMSACATAQTITSTEVIRDPDSFGDICRGLHVYGAKVLRPEALVTAFFSIG
ncbi:hypothetical protein N8469_00235 [bacterium]|nr:hypothetical protein [bacterium]